MTPFLDRWVCRQAGIEGTDTPEAAAKELAAFQWAALERTLVHAKEKSRFYRERLAGVEIRNVRGTRDLDGIPFTRPGDIREQAGALGCLSQDKVCRIFTLETSGTTARPKRLFFTREDLDATIDFFAACLADLMAPGDRGLIFLPGGTPLSAGDLIRQAMESIGAVPRVHGLVQDAGAASREIAELSPCLIIGLPVQILALGEMMARSGGTIPQVPWIILTADHVSAPVEARIARLFKSRVLSHYGLTETGFGGALQCPAREGLHLRHPHLLVEIVDPWTGRPLAPGQWGEIVVTTLDRQAMPLIRYRTGDLSRLLAGPCACGSPFPRLDHIRNRGTEGIALGAGPSSNIGPDIGSGIGSDLESKLAPGPVLTMADLDDALFSLDGVVDFTAGIRGDPGRAILDLTVESVSPLSRAAAASCLKTSGRIKKAIDKGLLSLGNIETRACTFAPSYIGKRLIRDLRPVPPPCNG